MKIVIPNRDIDDPADTKEVSPVELDLEGIGESQGVKSPDFSGSIAKAAADATQAIAKEEHRKMHREVQARAEAEFKAVADRLKQETGVSVGYERPWAYQAKPKAAYGLWKRVVTMFVEHPKTLDIGPTALAKTLAANEPNFTITRDMMYDTLNSLAEKDLVRLLVRLGVALTLKKPVSIRSVQNQLKERRDAACGLAVDGFSGDFLIQGDKFYINGTAYAIQLGASGKRRIKVGSRDWLPLDTLKAACLRTR